MTVSRQYRRELARQLAADPVLLEGFRAHRHVAAQDRAWPLTLWRHYLIERRILCAPRGEAVRIALRWCQAEVGR